MATLAYRLAALLAVLAMTGSSTAAEHDASLLVIVATANASALTPARLESIFLRKELRWDDGARVIPINGPPDSPHRRRFDRVVLGMAPEESARYWLDLRIRGGGTAPREVGDAVVVVKLVAKVPGTIGYVPATTALDGVRVVARIHQDKVISP